MKDTFTFHCDRIMMSKLLHLFYGTRGIYPDKEPCFFLNTKEWRKRHKEFEAVAFQFMNRLDGGLNFRFVWFDLVFFLSR